MTRVEPKAPRRGARAAVWAAAFAALALPAAAQNAENAGISLELSSAQDRNGSCLLSFLAQNGHGKDADSVVYEVVLFDGAGAVSQLTLLDFEDLPASRPRVRQFAFPGKACSDISRILINGAETCTGEGLGDGACTDTLDLKSRVETTELIG